MSAFGGLALQVADRLLLGGDDFVGWRVALGDVQAELALGQVAHVPHARLDDIPGAQELVDRLGLLGLSTITSAGPRTIAGPLDDVGRLGSGAGRILRAGRFASSRRFPVEVSRLGALFPARSLLWTC